MEIAKDSIQNDVTGIQNDALRFGLSGVKSDISAVHPLQSLMKSVIPLFHGNIVSSFSCHGNFNFIYY